MAKSKELDVSTLENWLWEAACKIRGPVDAPRFKDYILPLVFLKRLSDVFEDELAALADQLGDAKTAGRIVEDDHNVVRFYLPQSARWPSITSKTTGLGEHLTDAVLDVAKENARLAGVVDVVDFNASAAGQRIISDEQLVALVQVLGQYRLGLNDVEPDILGRAYEYLLRKFAEGSGQSAGEFYTPRQVAILMARILDPQPGAEIYDPCCGSSGLLMKCHLRLLETQGVTDNGRRRLPQSVAPLRLFGQEINHTTYAMAKMNAFIHDMDADVRLGDTMNGPRFLSPEGALRRFGLVTANPMWNQHFSQHTYENDGYDRFAFGYPPSDSADWGWIQHMLASLKDGGKMAVVLDTGAVSRGSGNVGRNREREIRRQFVERDVVEAVILLPENMFYNTTAPAIILVINKAKRKPGEILLINASKLFKKGRPKNYLPEDTIEKVADVYQGWKEEDGISTVVSNEEVSGKNDYNLSPSRYVAQDGEDDTLPLEDAVVLLQEAEEERTQADERLKSVLEKLGLQV